MAESGNEYQHGVPSEGMCCLCTMEDITDEDLNYGKESRMYSTSTGARGGKALPAAVNSRV
jgi:hypothetical protein